MDLHHFGVHGMKDAIHVLAPPIGTSSNATVTNLVRQAISAAGAAVTLATWWLILVSAAAATIILRA